MANHKSALKRAGQNKVRQMRNRISKTRMKNVVKKVKETLQSGAPLDAKQAMKEAQKVIDQVAAKGVIHKNTAARKISRLSKKIAALGS